MCNGSLILSFTHNDVVSLLNYNIKIYDERVALPQNDDDAIENIEAIADITERTFRCYLKQHFHREDCRKYDIAYLNGHR